MKANKFWGIPTAMVGIALLTASCQTDFNQPTVTSSTPVTTKSVESTIANDVQASSINQEVVTSTAEYMPDFNSESFNTNGAQKVKRYNTVVVTLEEPDHESFPKIVTIDFGTNGYVGKRMNVLRGKIIVTISSRHTKTYTFDNFSINENQIRGSKFESFNGTDTWTYSDKDTIVLANGRTFIRNTNRTHKLLDFNNTPFVYNDDTYAITGDIIGVNPDGKQYTMVADDSNPVISYTGYNYFIKGKITMSCEGKTAVVDFGDGTHDSLATITMDGETKEINLAETSEVPHP
jgi:hypothetical protein